MLVELKLVRICILLVTLTLTKYCLSQGIPNETVETVGFDREFSKEYNEDLINFIVVLNTDSMVSFDIAPYEGGLNYNSEMKPKKLLALALEEYDPDRDHVEYFWFSKLSDSTYHYIYNYTYKDQSYSDTNEVLIRAYTDSITMTSSYDGKHSTTCYQRLRRW